MNGYTTTNTAAHRTSNFLRRTSNANAATLPAMSLASISDERLQLIKEAFDLFDTNKDGHIDYFELRAAMRALSFQQKKDEVLRILQRYGNGDGTKISEDNFINVMKDMISKRDPLEDHRKAFKLLDVDGTGAISVSNLRCIARELGMHITDDEIQAMVEDFDLDNDGVINEEEFLKIMTKST